MPGFLQLGWPPTDMTSRFCVLATETSLEDRGGPRPVRDLFGMRAQRAAVGSGRGRGKEEGPRAALKRRPTAFMHMISDELVA